MAFESGLLPLDLLRLMDPQVRQEFDEIRSLIRDNEKSFNRRMDRAEKRMDLAAKRMDRAEERMDRADERMDRAEERMNRADERMEKFDRRIEATRKLVEAGMKIVLRLGRGQEELRKSQQAFLDSLRKGGNGRHRAS